jgi:hypothetical protein
MKIYKRSGNGFLPFIQLIRSAYILILYSLNLVQTKNYCVWYFNEISNCVLFLRSFQEWNDRYHLTMVSKTLYKCFCCGLGLRNIILIYMHYNKPFSLNIYIKSQFGINSCTSANILFHCLLNMGLKVASSSNINTRLYPLASIYVIVNNIIKMMRPLNPCLEDSGIECLLMYKNLYQTGI